MTAVVQHYDSITSVIHSSFRQQYESYYRAVLDSKITAFVEEFWIAQVQTSQVTN
jgi:hypothetical protein